VGSIDDTESGDGLTIRERLDAHRSAEACAVCHARIDPLGCALENYDSIGRWRDSYEQGKAIDVTGTTDEGRFIDGPAGLRTYLHERRPLFQRTLATKLLSYALGRGELLSDRPLIEKMTAALDNDARFSDLVDLIVTSRQFRMQRGIDYADPAHPVPQSTNQAHE
jgi:hypothetical protein